MKTVRYITLAIAAFLAAACDSSMSREEERSVLDKTKTEILALAKSSPCAEDAACRFVALGSKACGGPTSYLTYPASVDTVQLLTKVAQYNASEAAFNIKWSVVSDCSLVVPPGSVTCVSGNCVSN